MRTNKSRAVPKRLAAARRRIERWRTKRKIGSRIPERLWAVAVQLAEEYGIHATARALKLDYYSLKKRLEEQPACIPKIAAPAIDATFVELASAVRTQITECRVELENGEGTKMRIQLRGVEPFDLAALSRSLWGAQ